MIDKVLPGQRVTADTTNKMIDICNGLQTPSESFVNTPNGTLTPVPGYQAKYTYLPVPETVLQAKRGPALKMTSRGTTRAEDEWSQDQRDMTWFCFLGPDTETLAKCLPASTTPDSIWIGNSDSALFAEVTDSMLSSLRPAGYYVDLAAYGEDSVAVKEVKLSKSDDDEDPGKTVLVICGAGLDNFDKVQEDSRYSEYDDLEVVNTVLFAKTNSSETPFQLPLKSLASVDSRYVGDTQLSDLSLSSVEVQQLSGKQYITLHGFGDGETKQWQDLSSKGDYIDLLVRDIDSEGPPAGIELKYVALTSILDGLTVSANVSVDSETTSLSSIQRDEDGALQLFGFAGDDIKDYSQISADGDYDIILRNRGAGYRAVEYTSLSAIASNYTGDSQLTSVGKKSIQVKQTDDGEKYVQLYDFEVPRATGDAEVSLSCGEWKYIGKSSGSAPDPNLQFVVRDLASNEIKYADVRVKLPMIDATRDVVNIENAISNYITNISSDIQGDLSAQLSNYWKVDGTYDDNCHGQSIGDSAKAKVIDLDNKALTNGGVNSVNWGTCVLRDQNNNMAACWGNTANIGRTLRHSQGMATVDWGNMQLQTRARGTTVDWEQRELRGAWKIVRGEGEYSQATLTIGSTTINETQLQQLLALINP